MPEDRKLPNRRRVGVPLVAVAASLAVHLALVVALVLWSRGSPPSPARSVALQVELRTLPPPPGAAVPPPAASAAAKSPRRATAAAPTARARGGAQAASEAADARGPEGLGEPSSGGPGAGAGPDLHVRWPFPSPGAAAGARRGDPAGEGALAGWTREVTGRARAESGLVHPYYRDVGRAFVRAWDADGAVRKGGVSKYLAELGDNAATFGRVWRRLADGYGRTGAPTVIDGGSARMRELSGLPDGPARDALVAREIQRQLRPITSEGHVATVRVTQTLTGGLVSIELLSPSADPELDRAAMAGVRAAALGLPPPPDEARAGREALVSTWEFELEISITPPLPMIAIEFDEVLGAKDLRIPLDRRVWKRVRLVALN